MPQPKQAADGTWFIRYDAGADPRTGKRRQRKKGNFATKRACEQWYARWLTERAVQRGEVDDSITLSEYLQGWLRAYTARAEREVTALNYETTFRRHVTPHIGGLTLSALTPAQLEDWHAELRAKGLKRSTVHRIHGHLSTALKAAERRGIIAHNPAAECWPPAERDETMTFLTRDQARSFLDACPENVYGLLFRTALLTGMRVGELLALEWGQVDLKRRIIHVVATETRTEHGAYTVGSPKSKKSRRSLRISTGLARELAAHRRRQLEEFLTSGHRWPGRELVFAKVDGTALHRHTIYYQIGRTCERAGVPRVSMHALRHTAATLMVEMNEHIRIIQERLGHDSIQMTMRYTHVTGSMQQGLGERLERFLAGADDEEGEDLLDYSTVD